VAGLFLLLVVVVFVRVVVVRVIRGYLLLFGIAIFEVAEVAVVGLLLFGCVL